MYINFLEYTEVLIFIYNLYIQSKKYREMIIRIVLDNITHFSTVA